MISETLLVLSHPVVVGIMGSAIVLTLLRSGAPALLLYIGMAYLAYAPALPCKSGLPPSSGVRTGFRTVVFDINRTGHPRDRQLIGKPISPVVSVADGGRHARRALYFH